MAAVFWDTNLFIYLIEERPRELHGKVVAERKRMLRRGDLLVTSALTLGEVLVHPLREGRPELADRYSKQISEGALVLPLDAGAARKYAELRAHVPTLRPPDAVQLAAAGHHGVATFITNDHRLHKVKVSGIGEIIALEDVAA